MSNNPGNCQPAASRSRDTQRRGYGGGVRTRGRPCRSVSSAWMTPSSSSRRARPDPAASAPLWSSKMAAAAFTARQACCRATVVAGWSRGRRQRAASRHRPGCRAARQAGDACGSSRWAVPARTTETIESTLSICLAGWRLLPAVGPFPRMEQRPCWPGKLRGAGTSGVVPKRVLPSLHRPAAPAIASGTTPHSQGDVTAVPYSTSALARKLIVCSATTR
jgi:hypothetical protein